MSLKVLWNISIDDLKPMNSSEFYYFSRRGILINIDRDYRSLTKKEKTAKVIKAALVIVAMTLLVIPDPSSVTKWISGFIFGAIVKYCP